MNSYHNILDKLSKFSNRYYTKMLLKGILLFVAFGLLFFIITLAVEYFLWLSSTGRFILLLVFICTELYLAYKYIATPLFYLFKIKRGISNKEASVFIGKHFPSVGDRLLNLLDLAEDANRSELLLASIDQRSEALRPIPFVEAIDFKENLKYVKHLAIPLLLLGVIWISGDISSFFGSYNRVVNYDLAYEPPAPFSFQLLSKELQVLESEPYTLSVRTEGAVQPDNVYLKLGDKSILLQKKEGTYQYTFTPPLQNISFYFEANEVVSKSYNLIALKAPAIQRFNMILDYPRYTNKAREQIKSTGNATFPEGTKVTWEIAGKHTNGISFITKDTTEVFRKEESAFSHSKKIYNSLSYQLATSNTNVKNYETLAYNFTVIKDAYPGIKVERVNDSLNPNVAYFVGEATDDYKLRNISLVYYPDDNQEQKQRVLLQEANNNFAQFYYTYPSGLVLDAQRSYSFYFTATDNDGVHGGKTTKSQVFSMSLLGGNQLKNKQLEDQQSLLNNLDKSLDAFKEQKASLKELNKEQKEKKSLSFNDQNKVKDFLKKQQQQEQLMQKFSKQLKENLDKGDQQDEMNKLLKERLERQEIAAQKNEKLLEELNKVADKINKEELAKRLEELGKKQQNSERSLEQLLELTKRYYVTEKAAQLANELDALAKQQEQQAKENDTDGAEKKQEELNQKFDALAKELDELKKDNARLKKPMSLDIDNTKKESVKEDQQEALEELNKKKEGQEAGNEERQQASQTNAGKKQQSAADKMKQMSKDLQQSSSAAGGGGSSITEDAEMLRQILDNLVIFSFKQEQLLDAVEVAELDIAQFSQGIRRQQELRNLFEHVDDSLFALSLRRAELSEFVNEQITEVYYNADKALERMAERQLYQATASQQSVLTASNSLADFLANLLDNMQQSMQSGSGSGGSKGGFQLPDIIQGQGEVQKKMNQMGESGSGGKSQQGKGEPQQGEGGQEGQGKKGQGDKEGEGQEGGQKGNGNKNGDGGEGKGNKPGQRGEGGSGGGQGQLGEQELKEIYEIYKEQQRIRAELEQQLQNIINSGDQELGKKLVQQMEDFENDLLENGITKRTLDKVNNIQHQLLKLENATLKQGQKEERKSNTSLERFQNPITTKPALLKNYKNEIEILNRQALPLQQIYREKVKNYFKSND